MEELHINYHKAIVVCMDIMGRETLVFISFKMQNEIDQLNRSQATSGEQLTDIGNSIAHNC